MNPNELRQKKAAALAKAAAINDTLSDASLGLTDEQHATQLAKYEELVAEAKGFEDEAKAIEDNEAASRRRADDLASLGQQSPPAQHTDPAPPGTPDVEVSAPAFTKDPMKGFATPNEYFSFVTRASMGNTTAMDDPRVKHLAVAGSDEQQAGSDPYGGFLVPEAMAPGVHTIDLEPDPFVGRTTPMPMNATTVKVNAVVDKDHSTSVSGGFTVSRSSETASKNATRTKLEQVKFEANSEFGFSHASEELLRDSPDSVAALMANGFNREFQSNHVKEMLRGTGVGEREGVQNSPALITVAKEGSQAADTVVFNNLAKMRSRCYGYSGAIWVYNHDVLPQLMVLTLPGAAAAGVAAWQSSARDDEPDRLFGRPAFPSEYCETVGDKNDIMLIVPRAINEGTYQPLESAESIHVRFDRHERAFKFWQRNDAKSLWRSVLTPNKGATLSPFVTLAARA